MLNIDPRTKVGDHSFWFERAPDHAALRIDAMVAELDILQGSPLIGRTMALGQREPVTFIGASCYLTLNRFDPAHPSSSCESMPKALKTSIENAFQGPAKD